MSTGKRLTMSDMDKTLMVSEKGCTPDEAAAVTLANGKTLFKITG